MGRRILIAACLFGLASLLSMPGKGAARAEAEFKYGMAIVKTFGWDDLAERAVIISCGANGVDDTSDGGVGTEDDITNL